MLGKNAQISVDANGKTVAVQALKAGDMVFDILSNTLQKITEIKSRPTTFDRHQTERPDSILQPVKLKKGCVDGLRPSKDLITSPAQEIFVDKTPGGRRAVLSVEMAFEQLSSGNAELVDCASERYYAIFTATGCSMLANGMLVRSYNRAVVDA